MSDRAKWLSFTWLAALLPFAWLVHRFNHLIDDAFISFRYSHHLAEGLGLRYNLVGDPVEGFSNPLWVVLLAVAEVLGVSPEVSSIALGVLCSTLLLWAVHRFATRRLELPPLAAFAGVLFLATFPPFAVWTSGGLETAAFTLVLFLTWTELTREDDFRPWRAVLLASALTTLRPEGFLWALGLLVAGWIVVPGRGVLVGRLKGYVAPLAAVLVVLLVARTLYYHDLVPNTVRAKGSLTGDVLLRGAKCVASYFLVCLSPALILLLSPLGLRGERRRFVLSALLVFTAGLLWCVGVGGDWMAFFRFLTPFSPFLALLLALALSSLPRVAVAGIAAGVVTLSLLPAFGRHLVPRDTLEACDYRAFKSGFTTELERFHLSEKNLGQFLATGRALAEIAAPGDSLVFGAIGAIGYYSGVTIHDRNGLIDREVGSLGVKETSSAGHDKRVPRAYFASRKPTWYDAIFVARQAGSRQARQILGNRMRRAAAEGIEEHQLFELTVPELIPVQGDGEHYPAGWLCVWRGTDSVEEAMEGWAEYELP